MSVYGQPKVRITDRVMHAVTAGLVLLMAGLIWWGREWFIIVLWSLLQGLA